MVKTLFRLRLLGSPDLTRPDGAQALSVLAQPKRLALLAYLVADSGRQHSRDELIGIFWPDRDEDDARNALRQALHYLRRSLAEGVVISRGDQLGVDHDLLECDVVDFEHYVACGDLEKALDLYRGDFMEGLHVSGCPEFEHWRDQRSATLRRSAVEAATTLSRRSEEDGNVSTAVEFARRSLALAPSDESQVRALMRLLASSGDRGGAVEAYTEFERRFREELELEPSPATMTLLHEIRDDQAVVDTGAATAEASDWQQEGAPLAPLGPAESGPVPPATGSSDTVASGLRRRIALAAASVLFVIAAVAVVMSRTGVAAAPDDEVPRLVVLPFVNLSSPDEDYFAAGMTEEITSTLSGFSGLRVIARQTAVQYEGSPLSAREIADELDVDYVLEGTVRTDRALDGSGQVRISPRLIRGSDEAHVWAEPSTVSLIPGDIFRIQAEIAARIADGMDVVLLEPELEAIALGGTDDPEAYDYYLRGRSYFDRDLRRLEDRRLAADMFERAVAADPNYVEAYAMLARTYTGLGSTVTFSQADAVPKARSAAERAIQLAPDHPAALSALGEYHYRITGRLDLAEGHVQAARQAWPNDASVLRLLASIQVARGKRDEGTATLEGALELDPRTGVVSLARYRMNARRYVEAEALFDRGRVLTPDSPWPYFLETLLYLYWEGSTERARGVVEAAAGRADLVNLMLVSWDFDDAMVLRIFADHFDDAIQRRSLDDPADSVAYYFAKGDAAGRNLGAAEAEAYYDSARVVLERRLENSQYADRTMRNLGLAYARSGRAEDARRIAGGLPVQPIVAEIYLLLGDYDDAVDRLEQLSEVNQAVSVPMLRIDPLWDPLRDHPRFQALLAR